MKTDNEYGFISMEDRKRNAVHRALVEDDPNIINEVFKNYYLGTPPVFPAALEMNPLPTKVMDAYRPLLRGDWINKIPHDLWPKIDWDSVISWWAKDAKKETILPLQGALGFILSQSLSYSASTGKKHAHLDISGEDLLSCADSILDAIGVLAEGKENFLDLIGGSEGEAEILAGLGSIIIMRPASKWIRRGHVEQEELLQAVLLDSESSMKIFRGWDENTSLLQMWTRYNPENAEVWEKVVYRYSEEIGLAKDWARVWVPNGVIDGSPIQSWFNGNEVPGEAPINHPYFSDTSIDKMAKMDRGVLRALLRNHLRGTSGEGEGIEASVLYQRLSKFAQKIDATAPRIPFCSFHPSYESLLMLRCTGTDNRRQLSRIAIDPKTAGKLQDLLSDPYEQNTIRFLPLEEIIDWAENNNDWVEWCDANGRSLFHIWADASPQKISQENLEKIFSCFPQWLIQKDQRGKSCINTLYVDEEVRSSVKRGMLSSFAGDKENRSLPKM